MIHLLCLLKIREWIAYGRNTMTPVRTLVL